MYRFLRTPRWIAFTAAIVLLMAGMLTAARWQWQRHLDRDERNEAIEERMTQAPVPAEQAMTVGEALADDAEWRLVTASGTWSAAGQVLVANRSFQGQGGNHVITPLELADGTVLLVNRGWVGVDDPGPAPPLGPVTVAGRIRASQTRGSFGPRDPADGVLTTMARVDVARIAAQLDAPVLPGYVELAISAPAVAPNDPRPVELPTLDGGPHVSYTVQWLIFTMCAAVGWFIVVRRTARQQAAADTHR